MLKKVAQTDVLTSPRSPKVSLVTTVIALIYTALGASCGGNVPLFKGEALSGMKKITAGCANDPRGKHCDLVGRVNALRAGTVKAATQLEDLKRRYQVRQTNR